LTASSRSSWRADISLNLRVSVFTNVVATARAVDTLLGVIQDGVTCACFMFSAVLVRVTLVGDGDLHHGVLCVAAGARDRREDMPVVFFASEVTQSFTHVFVSLGDDGGQERNQVKKLSVCGVLIPCQYMDSVLLLPLKVFFQIVNDDGTVERSTNFGQVFDVMAMITLAGLHLDRVLSIESVRDVPVRVQLVKHFVSILLVSSRENDQFEVLGELVDELLAVGAHVENGIGHELLQLFLAGVAPVLLLELFIACSCVQDRDLLVVVNQCLVQVKHQGVVHLGLCSNVRRFNYRFIELVGDFFLGSGFKRLSAIQR